MRNCFRASLAILAVAVALVSCCPTFAQTYGTKGYAPGTWKPEELPKDLAKPKAFSAHDLSGVWSMPTKPGYLERH